MIDKGKLVREIANVLNRCGVENESNTPDFILAEYLASCLMAFSVAVNSRDDWYEEDHDQPSSVRLTKPECPPNRIIRQGEYTPKPTQWR